MTQHNHQTAPTQFVEANGIRFAYRRFGKSDGVPDPDWAKRVCVLLEQGATETLLAEATSEQMLRAGNVGGELLDWIAMLGAVGARRPKFVTPQMEQGHAYAAWSWS